MQGMIVSPSSRNRRRVRERPRIEPISPAPALTPASVSPRNLIRVDTTMNPTRLSLLLIGLITAIVGPGPGPARAAEPGRAKQPNVIILLTDDNGYGDL